MTPPAAGRKLKPGKPRHRIGRPAAEVSLQIRAPGVDWGSCAAPRAAQIIAFADEFASVTGEHSQRKREDERRQDGTVLHVIPHHTVFYRSIRTAKTRPPRSVRTPAAAR